MTVRNHTSDSERDLLRLDVRDNAMNNHVDGEHHRIRKGCLIYFLADGFRLEQGDLQEHNLYLIQSLQGRRTGPTIRRAVFRPNGLLDLVSDSTEPRHRNFVVRPDYRLRGRRIVGAMLRDGEWQNRTVEIIGLVVSWGYNRALVQARNRFAFGLPRSMAVAPF
jgi:hypothetical protein